MRGGEKVLEAICRAVSRGADSIRCCTCRGRSLPRWNDAGSRLRSFSGCPGRRGIIGSYLPLFPTAIEQFDFDAYDLVISTSHCAAKSVVSTRSGTPPLLLPLADAVCVGSVRRVLRPGSGRTDPMSRLLRPVLAGWPGGTPPPPARVDRYVANSQYVAGRIGRYYNREAAVVYPPSIQSFTSRIPLGAPSRSSWSSRPWCPTSGSTSRSTPATLCGMPLKIVGPRPGGAPRCERARRRPRAVPRVADRRAIRGALSAACAVLLPGVEDFGMVPVEAQACGTSGGGIRGGGALETVHRRRQQVCSWTTPSARRPCAAAPRPTRCGDADVSTPRSDPRAAPNAIRARHAFDDRDSRRPSPARVADTRARAMMRRYNRLLVAFYVICDALLGMAAFVARLLVRFASRAADPDHQGHPAVRAVRRHAAVHRRCSCRSRSRSRASTGCGAAGRASTTSSPCSSAASSRSSSASVGTLYVRTYYVAEPLKDPAPTRSRSSVWALFLVVNVAFTYALARAGSRGARAPLAGRHRPEARAHRRRRRSGPDGRRQGARAPRARLQGGRLHRRSGRRRSHRLPRPAAARHARRGGRDHPPGADRSRLRRAAARRARQDARPGRGDQPRRGRRPRRARPAAVHRAARAPRESRRRSDHQPQRRSAARVQQPAEARHRRRDLRRRAARPGDPLRAHRLDHQAHVAAGPVFYTQERMGLDGKAFNVYKFRSMYDGRRGRDRADLGARRRPALHAGRQMAAALRPRRTAAALERVPRRHVDRRPAPRASATSSSSSSIESRSTCCATR